MTKGCPTDGELLARFVETKDAPAFEEIVRRHAPMVRRVCGRILCAAPHDVDDVVQNVFMTLARRASALWTRATVAGWLHRTACHTAMRWRRDAQTRRRHERLAAESRPDPRGGAGLEDPELLDQVYGALHALPEAYRDALVLHHVEGYTIEEAAALLAAPVGTVAARVSRGRQMIRRRLHDRGTVVAAPVLVAQLGVDAEGESTGVAWTTSTRSAESLRRAGWVVVETEEIARAARQSIVLSRSAFPATPMSGGTATVVAPTIAVPLFGHLKVATVAMAIWAGSVAAAAGGVVTYHVTQSGEPATKAVARDPEPAKAPTWTTGGSRDTRSVPEPSSTGLVAAGATLMLRRGRRAMSPRSDSQSTDLKSRERSS
jgi:RNA polymerase sigma factor (sigma-70 family)